MVEYNTTQIVPLLHLIHCLYLYLQVNHP